MTFETVLYCVSNFAYKIWDAVHSCLFILFLQLLKGSIIYAGTWHSDYDLDELFTWIDSIVK